jgi:N-acetylmuramoyl-L-alanine amidase
MRNLIFMVTTIRKRTRATCKPFGAVAAGLLLGMSLLPARTVEAAGAAEPLLAFSARIAGDDARTRIIVDFDRKPEFSVHYVSNPERVVIDLPATAFGFRPDELAARGLFKDIRYGTMDQNSARIVLTANRPVRLAVARVQADEGGKGFRLVLDAEVVSKPDFAKLLKAQSWQEEQPAAIAARGDRLTVESDTPAPDNTFVIAIDAGHGGIDIGAVGGNTKTEEKGITLAFAKALAERLNKQPGIKAILTRDTDRYLSLSERVVIARQQHAQLFISLHADTLRQRNIRGSTVYTISDTASDNMAADLADRENLSDAVAGGNVDGTPADVSDILLDFTKRETQAFSIAMAKSLVGSFEGQVALINNPHRHAGFRVLQAPDVPSILLELGFLSNADDEKLLLDDKWRDKMAGLLTEAVTSYRARAIANGG